MTSVESPSATLSYADRWSASLTANYGLPPLTLVRGRGAQVWDAEGRRYVDFLAGIAVNSLGHAHPAIVEAVSRQVATLGHTSNLAITTPALELAERLISVAEVPDATAARVFFCNSGTEANEAAFKISRLTGRTHLVAATGAFHGRTMGSLALTGQPAKTQPFEPLPGDVTHVPYGDVNALTEAVGPHTAAIVLEPIQGESGVVVPPVGYLAAARQIATDNGALLILDEVQTGIGRTGSWFAFQDPHLGGIRPDVVTLAKGLGGGLPIGAVLAFGSAAWLLTPGTHGSTFGGNPVCAAAGLAVLDTIESEQLLARVRHLGEQLTSQLRCLPGVRDVRGRGLLLGVVLTGPHAADVERHARSSGLLVNAAAADVIRLAPPFVLTDAEAAEAVAVLADAIAAVLSDAPSVVGVRP